MNHHSEWLHQNDSGQTENIESGELVSSFSAELFRIMALKSPGLSLFICGMKVLTVF